MKQTAGCEKARVVGYIEIEKIQVLGMYILHLMKHWKLQGVDLSYFSLMPNSVGLSMKLIHR